MVPEWQEVQARIDALAAYDKRRQAEGAAEHDYAFEAPADAAGVEAWLATHGAWLDRELSAFETIEEMFGVCKTMEDFRVGFLVRQPEMPFAMRLCSYLGASPPPQYTFEECDPEPQTVPFRWFEEQYRRYRTRHRFQGGIGGLLRAFPRKRVSKHG